ncbi:MAG TPA: ABC transporter permease subunit [Steroidobacter sp.]|uniref:ABC transporter permease subunit n=1 Tax=Steroidobacter sp. TaxID=1978227 RepID=UPI002ED79EE5
MSARAELPSRHRHSAGVHLILDFLQRLPPYRWTRARLVRWGLTGRTAVVAIPYFWLLLFFLVPFIIVLKIAFAEARIGIPPYSPLIQWLDGGAAQIKLNFATFANMIQDSLYWKAYLNSIKVAAIATVWCLLLGYPMAYAIARAQSTWRHVLLMMVILPFWTSFLLRVYAWIGILKNNGLINNFLMWTGIIDEPIVMLQTDFAIYIGIVYSYLPFMILPLYSNLEKMDLTLLEAAADLGARPVKTFLTITLPLSMPGIVAGSMLVFIPAVGEFVIPELLGPSDSLMIGKVLWQVFFTKRDWPAACAVAIALLLLLVIPIVLLQRSQAAEARGAHR